VNVIVGRFAADHGSQAPSYYRIHPTLLDEMTSETTGHAAFDERRERILELDGFEFAEEADVWRAFRGLRPGGSYRPLSLGYTLVQRIDKALRKELGPKRGEWFPDD
jgi:hypothetical protein